jgi:hypothetical protein
MKTDDKTWKEILELYREYEARKAERRISFWELIKLYL